MNITSISDLIELAGGGAQVGDICGVSRMTPSHWRSRGLPSSEFEKTTEYVKEICDYINRTQSKCIDHNAVLNALREEKIRVSKLKKSKNKTCKR